MSQLFNEISVTSRVERERIIVLQVVNRIEPANKIHHSVVKEAIQTGREVDEPIQ